jgi:hypothetical protein
VSTTKPHPSLTWRIPFFATFMACVGSGALLYTFLRFPIFARAVHDSCVMGSNTDVGTVPISGWLVMQRTQDFSVLVLFVIALLGVLANGWLIRQRSQVITILVTGVCLLFGFWLLTWFTSHTSDCYQYLNSTLDVSASKSLAGWMATIGVASLTISACIPWLSTLRRRADGSFHL